ncbi:MAG: hypothetical protein BZY81_04220 [SAR202 cluster bacterium Io17-Chloro-G4]|nr:MAG: hypothetical protein BZY81_04220 [SAR202 cluster bacterium Io17-Chloro-G4]
MNFGVAIWPGGHEELAKLARLAEEQGFDYIGIPESQSLAHELYVSLSVVAYATGKARIGPSVTNPLTRHPAVTASAIASINDISGGRAFLGIGTGDSAVLNLGLRPAKHAQMREYIDAVRTVLTGQQYEYQGRQIHVKWSQSSVPMMISAEGPRTLALGGEIADIVMVHTGLSTEVIKESIAQIRQGEARAGKASGTTQVWAFAKCNIADERDQAVEEIKMALAASGHHAFRFTLDGKHVPEEFRESIAILQREYVPVEHEQLGRTRNAVLSDELGLTDYLADRFAVVGTPEECRAKVRSIEAAGVDMLLITAIGPQPAEIIRRFGEDVIGQL